METQQPTFLFFECPQCEFTCIQERALGTEAICPLCVEDGSKLVPMAFRTALSTDHAEGHDSRPSMMRP
jgi:hypothetical protein